MSSQPEAKPPLTAELVWAGDLRFTTRVGDITFVLDSDGRDGPSPMQALAGAVAGCMAMDLVHFLDRSRVPASALRVSLTGERAPDHPRRFVAIQLHFDLDGTAADDVVARGLQLSREKYCSVWNSMRQDIELHTTFTVNRGASPQE